MKKAKMMLAAIAVFGLVGGALAFSAQKSNLKMACANAVGRTCTDITDFLTTDPTAGADQGSKSCTAIADRNQVCPAVEVYSNQ